MGKNLICAVLHIISLSDKPGDDYGANQGPDGGLLVARSSGLFVTVLDNLQACFGPDDF